MENNKLDKISNYKQQFLNALYKYHGNVSLACKAIGRSRQTIYDWKQADQYFRKDVDTFCEAGRESLADIAEEALLGKILKGDTTAIIFTLKSLRRINYGERTEVENFHKRKIEEKEEVIEGEEKIKSYFKILMSLLPSWTKNLPEMAEKDIRSFIVLKNEVLRISEMHKSVIIDKDDKSH